MGDKGEEMCNTFSNKDYKNKIKLENFQSFGGLLKLKKNPNTFSNMSHVRKVL